MTKNPVPEKGGYAAGGRTVSELPPPPPSVTTSPAQGVNPKLLPCAAELAAHFRRVYARKAASLPGEWADLAGQPPEAVAAALYSLLYSGTILCPIPEHRIGVSLRADADD